MPPTRHSTLISATELIRLLADGHTVPPLLLDCSFDLTDAQAGMQAYAKGHLPGAFYLHLDHDLSAGKHPGGPRDAAFTGRHPLPDAPQLRATLRSIGFTPGRQVIAYDNQGGPYAARAWWLLQAMGHRETAVLDGGVAAWLAAGGELSTEKPEARSHANDLETRSLDGMSSVTAQSLRRVLGKARLIDARAPARFRGEMEPLDPVAGHIPGASNRFFQLNLASDGRFKTADVLREEWAALGITPANAREVVHQCGSGVTACHNLLAMAHAGLHGSALYPGSWSEWCADSTRPVARG